MDWVELLSGSGDRALDFKAQGQAMRTFHVHGYSANQVITEPGTVVNGSGVALPVYNSPFASSGPLAGMLLEQYVTQQRETFLLVEARYSSDRRWTLRPRPREEDPGYEFLADDSYTFEDAIPFAERVNTVNPSTGSLTQVWAAREWSFNAHGREIIFRTNVSNISGSARDQIHAQTNRIHFISVQGTAPSYWQFLNPSIIDQAASRTMVEYRWRSDPGIDFSIGLPTAPLIKFRYPGTAFYEPAGSNLWQGKHWIRPPHHRLQMMLTYGPDPVFIVQPVATLDPNGWVGLPGL